MDEPAHSKPTIRASGERPSTLRMVLARSAAIDLRDMRVAGTAMLFLAVTLPLVPGYPGIPCLLRTFTGVPCPFCGMSTSVKEAVRLQLREAWTANPAGIAAVLAAVLLIVFRPRRMTLPVLMIPAILAAMWIGQLVRFSIL
ncbi:MAG: DUF2752 domain-containing protein [Actinomycetota bacterium]|nr:DUF2752 domain-containing protein [Actinomycetota bacterium]